MALGTGECMGMYSVFTNTGRVVNIIHCPSNVLNGLYVNFGKDFKVQTQLLILLLSIWMIVRYTIFKCVLDLHRTILSLDRKFVSKKVVKQTQKKIKCQNCCNKMVMV